MVPVGISPHTGSWLLLFFLLCIDSCIELKPAKDIMAIVRGRLLYSNVVCVYVCVAGGSVATASTFIACEEESRITACLIEVLSENYTTAGMLILLGLCILAYLA